MQHLLFGHSILEHPRPLERQGIRPWPVHGQAIRSPSGLDCHPVARSGQPIRRGAITARVRPAAPSSILQCPAGSAFQWCPWWTKQVVRWEHRLLVQSEEGSQGQWRCTGEAPKRGVRNETGLAFERSPGSTPDAPVIGRSAAPPQRVPTAPPGRGQPLVRHPSQG